MLFEEQQFLYFFYLWNNFYKMIKLIFIIRWLHYALKY